MESVVRVYVNLPFLHLNPPCLDIIEQGVGTSLNTGSWVYGLFWTLRLSYSHYEPTYYYSFLFWTLNFCIED